MKRFFTVILFFIANHIFSQTTVTINCTGAAGSFNSGSVRAAGVKNDGEIIGLNNGGGNRGWASFNLSSIPAGYVITSATLSFTTYNSVSSSSLNDIFGFIGIPSSLSGATLYNSCGSGPSFNNSTWLANGANAKTVNATGLSFLQSNFGGTVNLGFVRTSANTYAMYGYGNGAALQPQLTLTYDFPPCTGTPSAGSIFTQMDGVCSSSDTFHLSVIGGTSSNMSGLTYQWQSSNNDTVWNNLPGQTSQEYSSTQATTTYYRRKISCGANSAYSTIRTIFSTPTISPGNTNTTFENICNTTTPFTLSTSSNPTWINGLKYQWQTSFDSTTWSNIPGATNITLNTTQTISTVYRRITNCGSNINYSLPKRVSTYELINGGIIKGDRYFCNNGQYIKLYITGLPNASGLTFQWQISNNGSSFLDISGATFDTLNIPINTETYYRRKTFCNGTLSYSNNRIIKISNAITPVFREFIGDGLSCLTPTNGPWSLTEDRAYLYNNIVGSLSETSFYLPSIHLIAPKTYTIRYYKSLGYDAISDLRLYVGTSLSSTNTILKRTTCNWSGFNCSSDYVSVDFQPTATGDYYFRWSLQGNSFCSALIKDVSIKLSPSCPAPLNLVVTNRTTTTTIINWNVDFDPGYDTIQNYKWKLNRVGTPATVDSGFVSTNQLSFANLQSGVQFELNLYSNCGMLVATQYSSLSNLMFTTLAQEDICSGATNISQIPYAETCNGTIINTAAAAPSPNPPTSFSADFDDDLWYKFTATSKNATFKFQNFTNTVGSSTGIVYALYSDSCNPVSLLACNYIPVSFGVGESAMSGLTIGRTYYLRLATRGVGTLANFKFCVMVPDPNTFPSLSGNNSLIACAGTPILITGSNLTGATAVSIGNVAASSFNVLSSASINAVFTASVSGRISVTTPQGIAVSDSISLTINPAPVTTLTAGCCIGVPIVVNANVGISQVTWFLNGNAIGSQNGAWQTYPSPVAGGNGSGSASNQFTNPFGVFKDSSGNIYVADAGNHRIQKFAPGNSVGVTVAGGNGPGSAANQLNNPRGVFVDLPGNIYVADAGNNRVQKWLPGSNSGMTVAGGNGQGAASNQLDFPHSISVDAGARIYIADANNNRVQKWLPNATTGTTVAGGNGAGNAANQLSYATGVYADTAGNVYVSDFNNNRVQKWLASSTTGITVAGGNGQGVAANQLDAPRGLYVDNCNNVYVADQNNHRIQKWPPGTTMGTTIAGGNGAGSAPNQLSSPAGVFSDNKGNVYVADRLNQRIAQFSLSNNFTYTPIQGGAYTALVSSTGCCSATTSPVVINSLNGPTICPGSSTFFVSGSGPGNIYQWQVNTGSGFVSLANNAVYAGATNDTLKLTIPASSWYGYSYRCLVNGTTYSTEYTLKFAVTWTGNSSTAWENSANWSCGVLPDGNTDVIINNGLSNYPLVNLDAACGSLKLMPGSTVTVKTGVKLDVKRK